MNKYNISSNDVMYSCLYHVVWCSKYRRKVLVDEVSVRLKDIIENSCMTNHITIKEMQVHPEHIQLVLEVDPQYGIHKVVKELKAVTSRVLREEFPFLKTKLPTLWSNSYLVTSIGVQPSEKEIENYIKMQKTSQRK